MQQKKHQAQEEPSQIQWASQANNNRDDRWQQQNQRNENQYPRKQQDYQNQWQQPNE